MENTATQSIGTLYGKKSGYFALERLKKITINNTVLEMCSVYPSDAMLILCESTGKKFLMPWADVLRLAIEAGILENDNKQ